MAKKYYLSEEDVRKLKQLVAARSAQPRSRPKRIVQEADSALFVKITSAINESPNKWRYGGVVVTASVDAGGALSWSVTDPVRNVGYLYNGCEAFNVPDPSIRGNGVNSGGSAYPDGFDLQPIRGTPVVLAFPVRIPSEDPGDVGGFRRIYIFSQVNADDGVCD